MSSGRMPFSDTRLPRRGTAEFHGSSLLFFLKELPYRPHFARTSLVAQSVKNLPAVQKTWVQSLGREDPLEKAMATQSSILAWKISFTEEPGGLQSMGS